MKRVGDCSSTPFWPALHRPGGTVFLKLKDAFPGGNVVGALLFTIGLFTVCTRGYAVYGKGVLPI